jgi:hypothetical protein
MPPARKVGILKGGAVVGEVTVDSPSVDSVFLLHDSTVYALDSYSNREGADCREAGVDGCAVVSGMESIVDGRRLRLSYVLESASPLIDQMSPSELGDFVKWGSRFVRSGDATTAMPISIDAPNVPALPAPLRPKATVVFPSSMQEGLASAPVPPPASIGSLRMYVYLVAPVEAFLPFWLGVGMRNSRMAGRLASEQGSSEGS